MSQHEASFEHVISSVDYSNPSPEVSDLIPFLDQELRPKARFSIIEEYPSLFGDFPGGSSLFIEKDGRVASHVGLLVREFIHERFRVRCGLIGSVATSSIFRGMGMASTLLKAALQELKQKRCTLAILWSDQAEFYLPLGFHRSGREVDLKFDPKQVPQFSLKSRPFDAAMGVEQLWRLYRRHKVKIDRSLEEMKRLVKIPHVKFFVTEKEGVITSYIAINKGLDFANYIHEWAGDLEAVTANVAFTQKEFFPETPLVLIGPASLDLSPLKKIASEAWEGALGLIKILDRPELLRTYENFLKSQNIPVAVKEQGSALEVDGKKYGIGTDPEFLKVVLGERSTSFPVPLPFFLWGFDSI